ncbi:MAG: hypothetical protein ACYDEY_03855 [Acidimicrobiales bacterium]
MSKRVAKKGGRVFASQEGRLVVDQTTEKLLRAYAGVFMVTAREVYARCFAYKTPE